MLKKAKKDLQQKQCLYLVSLAAEWKTIFVENSNYPSKEHDINIPENEFNKFANIVKS